MKRIILSFLLLFGATSLFAQAVPVQMDSARVEKYRIEIELDMSLPDFDIKSIDAKVMGSRLAGILDYLMENYHQAVYDRKICLILKEQNEALEQMEFQLKKMQFVKATKRGNEIALFFTVWPTKNTANVKKVDLTCHFTNGVSESQATNELFSVMSQYVQAREQLYYNY